MKRRSREHSKILIVEGSDDLHAVVGLMEHHTDWPDSAPYPVWVEAAGSVSEILAPAYLPVEIKAPNANIVGVILDADDNCSRRYQRVCQLVKGFFPSMPETLPVTGLIADNEDGKRFGLWVMPDNHAPGDLETFLRDFVPSDMKPLWAHACMSVSSALDLGAGCRDKHAAKANLYTWLAWQDPPGQSPGRALKQKLLDAHSRHAEGFIQWFKTLFHL